MNLSVPELAQIITALAALGGVFIGVRNSHKIQEVHLSINSRMDQLLKAAGEAAHAAGMSQEKAEATAAALTQVPIAPVTTTIIVPEQMLRVEPAPAPPHS